MQDYIVIDLEMTGLDPKRDAILEVGAARVRADKVTETLEFFVNPMRSLSQKVTELTGITQEMVESGVNPKEAIRRVAEFAGEDVWVGHNVIYDYSFLKQLAVNERIPFEKKAVDTLKLARRLLKEPEKKTLDALCGYYAIERAHAHRALDDACATNALYQRLRDEFAEEKPEEFAPKPL